MDAVQRDETFVYELTDALLNPKFQQAMVAIQHGRAPDEERWSWHEEKHEVAPEEFIAQLTCAAERLEAAAGADASASTRPASSGQGHPDLNALVAELGLATDLSESQHAALRRAPEVVERLTREIEEDGAGCSSQ
mmetsp:Transcript_78300/g.253617  ORF Transcript_78300/g.253617 Transcript_78300/m.253617 type:complete len:136 (-) Transcript_78300:113-520(-)